MNEDGTSVNVANPSMDRLASDEEVADLRSALEKDSDGEIRVLGGDEGGFGGTSYEVKVPSDMLEIKDDLCEEGMAKGNKMFFVESF